MNDLIAEMRINGIEIKPELNKGILRDGAEWFVGEAHNIKGKLIIIASYGSWKINSQGWKYRSDMNGSAHDPEAIEILNERIRAQSKARREEKHRFQLSQSSKLFEEFSKFGTLGYGGVGSKYMSNKGLAAEGLFGARLDGSGNLCIPMVDIDGKFWNFQRIFNNPTDGVGKKMQFGARVNGVFHVLESSTYAKLVELQKASEIYIAEGFATAASIALALQPTPNNSVVQNERGLGAADEGPGRAALSPNQADRGAPFSVVCAFSSGNLPLVAKAIRERFPSARITICGDNDAYTVINNARTNVGMLAAVAAGRGANARVLGPVFKEPKDGLTDFNDLHMAEGLEVVQDQLFKPRPETDSPSQVAPNPEPRPENGENAKAPNNSTKIEQKQPEKPKFSLEKLISENILKRFGSSMLRQGDMFFLYEKTHWVEQDSCGRDRIKQLIGKAAEGRLDSKKINGCWNYIMMHMPQVPKGIDFYSPNPYCANFQNGTLHLNGKTLEAKPHHYSDYLTSVLPFDCPSLNDLPGKTPLLDAYFARMWPDQTELHANVLLCEELIGACFMPAFPTITFLTGKSQTGKSTFLKLCNKLMSEKNVCHVDLCDMHGFNMASMIGALVNIDLDINTKKPIDDAQVKKIIDRMPLRIQRKYEDDVRGFVPAVHLFGSNGLPKSYDGAAQAYGRRFIFIACNQVVPGERPDMDYEDQILASERTAIIAKGIQGIRRLVESGGYYTRPKNSALLVDEMQRASDPVVQFFDDIKTGHYSNKPGRLEFGENRAIKPDDFWMIFKLWQDERVATREHIGRNAFYMRVKSLGFETRGVNGVRTFRGVGSLNHGIGDAGVADMN